MMDTKKEYVLERRIVIPIGNEGKLYEPAAALGMESENTPIHIPDPFKAEAWLRHAEE